MGQLPWSRSHGKKNNGTHGQVLSHGIHVKYQSSSTHSSKIISKVKVFKKWVKLQGQGHRVKKNNGTHEEVFSHGIHVKYQSSRTHSLKIISKVKVFKKWVKLQSQGDRVKNNGTHGKVLLQGLFMLNI